MVDGDSHLKLLPTSILDTYKVIEHIDMLSMGIQYHPYTDIPTLLTFPVRASQAFSITYIHTQRLLRST
jgi:hypothetical protein